MGKELSQLVDEQAAINSQAYYLNIKQPATYVAPPCR